MNNNFEASVSIQVLPKGKKSEVVRIVDCVIDYIKSTGINYFVAPFETTLEGNLDELMEITKKCCKICIDEGSEDVISLVKINYNPLGVLTIDEKIKKYNL